jgi:AhpD family alkylhydroperoxidase
MTTITIPQRFDMARLAGGGYKALIALEAYLLHESGLDHGVIHLIKLRVSQMNGCAFCIDMHWKDLRARGESEQRLYGLDAWEESPYYTEQERAALAWAEALTNLHDGHVSDAVYDRARTQFDDAALANLALAVAAINSWNRLAIASRAPAGQYRAKAAG